MTLLTPYRIVSHFRVEFGWVILSFGLVVSFFGSMNIGQWYDLTDIFQVNRQYYSDYMISTLLFVVLPPALGLTLSGLGFLRERKSPTGVLEWWFALTFFGAVFFSWVVIGLRWANTSSIDAERWLHSYGQAFPNATEVSNLVQGVYRIASIGYFLWLTAGLLFMLSYLFKERCLFEKSNWKIQRKPLQDWRSDKPGEARTFILYTKGHHHNSIRSNHTGNFLQFFAHPVDRSMHKK